MLDKFVAIIFDLILLTLILIAILYIIAVIIRPKPAPPLRHRAMDPHKEYHSPEHWKGAIIDQKNRFNNIAFTFYQNYVQVLGWLPSHIINLFKNRNKKFSAIIHSNAEFLLKENVIIWLGHASFYMNLNGIRILIDPHFYKTFIYKRHTPAPISAEFFTGIHYILLSHDHNDHCDKKSLKNLAKINPRVKLLTGLNMDKYLRTFLGDSMEIITADWYQKYPVKNRPEFYFIPSRHYCNKVGQQYNGRLWGGFAIKYGITEDASQTIYFGGDSGYDSHFKDVKALFKPQISILGIGAFKPRYLMFPNHMSPLEAVTAFDDSGALIMIPMHYGTFNLSNENMDDPLNLLNTIKANRAIVELVPGKVFHI